MGKLYIASNGSGVHSSEVTAKKSDVLAGTKTIMADSNDEVVEGGMIDHGAISKALKCGESITIPQGYHNGSGEISADSLASQTEGTATASDLYTGKTMVVNGQKITGTMKDLSKNTSIQYASDNSAKVIAGDAVFKAKNTDNVDRVCIRYNGENGFIITNTLFGIPSSNFGTVSTGNVLKGQTFTSTAGIKVTGTMSVQSAISFSAAAISYNTIRISWKNPARGPWQGVFIQMSTSGNPGTGGGSRAYTGRGNSSSANASNYVDITGLNANTTYYFTCTSYVDNLGWGTSYNVNAKTQRVQISNVLNSKILSDQTEFHFTYHSNYYYSAHQYIDKIDGNRIYTKSTTSYTSSRYEDRPSNVTIAPFKPAITSTELSYLQLYTKMRIYEYRNNSWVKISGSTDIPITFRVQNYKYSGQDASMLIIDMNLSNYGGSWFNGSRTIKYLEFY